MLRADSNKTAAQRGQPSRLTLVLLCAVLSACINTTNPQQANIADVSANQEHPQPRANTAHINAWRAFSREIENIGVQALEKYPQPTAIDSDEGLRYLLQQLSIAIQEKIIEQPDQISLLRNQMNTINKAGFDGADAKYLSASITPAESYRLHGTLGNAKLIALQIARQDQRYEAFASMSGEQLQADIDGHFSVILSAKKPAQYSGPWLAIDPRANTLLLREYFADWNSELPGEYFIETIRTEASADSQPLAKAAYGRQAELDFAAASALLDNSARRFGARSTQWQSLVERSQQHLVNRVFMQKTGQGLANNHYGSGWFKLSDAHHDGNLNDSIDNNIIDNKLDDNLDNRLDDQQVLLIEMERPEAELWSVQLGNVWWESLDYINRLASYNQTQAKVDNDGVIRFVIALEDPGVANWLDPAGHSQGAILFRLQNASDVVQPTMRKLSISELRKTLPADYFADRSEQRLKAIEVRRRHAARRWAP